jgi:hypothetical protein
MRSGRSYSPLFVKSAAEAPVARVRARTASTPPKILRKNERRFVGIVDLPSEGDDDLLERERHVVPLDPGPTHVLTTATAKTVEQSRLVRVSYLHSSHRLAFTQHVAQSRSLQMRHRSSDVDQYTGSPQWPHR